MGLIIFKRTDRPSILQARCRPLACLVACLVAIALVQASRAQTADIEPQLRRIERVQSTAAWFESQPLIDDLRVRLGSASVNQRSRLDLLEAANRLIQGRTDEVLASADSVLSRPVQPPVRLQAWRLGAEALAGRNDFAPAFEYVAEALRLADQIDSPADRAAVHALAARMHAEAGESALGLHYATEALRLAEASAEPAVVCDAWISLLRAQTEAGLLGPARSGTRTLWQRCQQAGDPERVAWSLGAIGRVYLADGDAPSAIGWLERGLEAQRQARMTLGRIDHQLALAQAYLADGQTDPARVMLEALLPELVADDRTVDQARALLMLSDVLAASGNHAAALRRLDEYRALPERPEDQRRAQQLAYLQVEFESQRRTRQLELLRQRRQIADQQISQLDARRRLRDWGLGLGIVVLALMAGLLVKLRVERGRLKRLTRVDGLTGLLNHRAFHDSVARQLEAGGAGDDQAGPRRSPAPGTLVAADIDLFKRVNDRHGHQAGDAVLRALGATLREHFAPPCVVGRVGGEEFAIWIPGCNRLQARQRITLLRQALGPVEFRGKSISYTMSFGLVEVRGQARLEHLRIQADRALYRAKRAGRDEIVDAGDLAAGSPA